jgi:hypothetical protein
MILPYVGRRIWRLKFQAMVLIALGLIFSMLLLNLNASLGTQRQKREEALVSLPILCVVADQRGEKTEDLYITATIFDRFVGEGGPLYPFLDKVCLKADFAFDPDSLKLNQEPVEGLEISSGERSIVAVTRIEAERNLAAEQGAEIHFLPGFSEECFQDTSRYYCLLPQDIYQLIPGGQLSVDIIFDSIPQPMALEYDLEVIGYYLSGGRDIYCNWQVAWDGFARADAVRHTDSLSFILKDNHKLAEFKAVAAEYFVKAGSTEHSVFPLYSLAIHDQQFNVTIFALDRNIRLMQVVLPIMNVLAIGIGFVVSYTYIRNRKQEFAIMVSLGTGKGGVFSVVFLEQALLSLLGISLGMLYWHLNNLISLQDFFVGVGLFACLMGGAAAAITRVLSIPVMAMLKTE